MKLRVFTEKEFLSFLTLEQTILKGNRNQTISSKLRIVRILIYKFLKHVNIYEPLLKNCQLLRIPTKSKIGNRKPSKHRGKHPERPGKKVNSKETGET